VWLSTRRELERMKKAIAEAALDEAERAIDAPEEA
jgi:hypothetical protein